MVKSVVTEFAAIHGFDLYPIQHQFYINTTQHSLYLPGLSDEKVEVRVFENGSTHTAVIVDKIITSNL